MKYYQGDYINDNDKGGECSMHGGNEKCTHRFRGENFKGGDHFGNLRTGRSKGKVDPVIFIFLN
jgi:hypothetical protein